MPKRTDIKKILIIGSGPIVIGQACEFDYSGTQACKALREEGYEVVLVNSNPATIMTDPRLRRPDVHRADHAGVRRPDHRTRSGPTRCCRRSAGRPGSTRRSSCTRAGVLAKYNVEMIGADYEVIKKAEDRELFKDRDGARSASIVPRSEIAYSMEDALRAREIDRPAVRDPAGVHAGRRGRRHRLQPRGVRVDRLARPAESLNSEVLIEESIAGWKEFELEVMRDKAKDNVVIICSIENFDPMGVHTGDSITVAPARRSPTASTRSCATRRSRSSARSASRPAVRTSSSR
jgi:carbamoyl-phosphate synthase large subunit